MFRNVVGSQAYHTLFVWYIVHLQWPYRLIKLTLLKANFRTFKTNENEIQTLIIAAMLFNFIFCVY